MKDGSRSMRVFCDSTWHCRRARFSDRVQLAEARTEEYRKWGGYERHYDRGRGIHKRQADNSRMRRKESCKDRRNESDLE